MGEDQKQSIPAVYCKGGEARLDSKSYLVAGVCLCASNISTERKRHDLLNVLQSIGENIIFEEYHMESEYLPIDKRKHGLVWTFVETTSYFVVGFRGMQTKRDMSIAFHVRQIQKWKTAGVLTDGLPLVCDQEYIHGGILRRVVHPKKFHAAELKRVIGFVQQSGKPLLLAGHSLGGAMAIVFAVKRILMDPHIASEAPNLCRDIQVITFGGLVAWNKKFVARANIHRNKFRNFILEGDYVPTFLRNKLWLAGIWTKIMPFGQTGILSRGSGDTKLVFYDEESARKFLHDIHKERWGIGVSHEVNDIGAALANYLNAPRILFHPS